MKKTKLDVTRSIADLDLEPAGFAHALNLLLLAIAKTNPAVGTLLDEFTATHADYLAQLQGLARESDDCIQAMHQFSQASKLIYQRLSKLDSEQSKALRAHHGHAASSALLH